MMIGCVAKMSFLRFCDSKPNVKLAPVVMKPQKLSNVALSRVVLFVGFIEVILTSTGEKHSKKEI
jgi:hypothetical protein